MQLSSINSKFSRMDIFLVSIVDLYRFKGADRRMLALYGRAYCRARYKTYGILVIFLVLLPCQKPSTVYTMAISDFLWA